MKTRISCHPEPAEGHQSSVVSRQSFFPLRLIPYPSFTFCILLFAFCILTSVSASAQSANWINDNSKTQVKAGTYIIVPGNVINQNSGTFDNSGAIHLYGNWTNNAGNTAFVNSSPGTVSLLGDTQLIGGTDPTLFFNLDLQGTGVKKLTVNSMAEGVLSLNDRELQTQNFTMSVLSADTSAITRITGYVSSTDVGCLSRAMDTLLPYFFPVGSALGTFRFRPVAITPTSVNPNTFSVRMANADATTEGFDRTITDGTVANINDKFYHRINRISGTDSAKITIYYDNVADGSFYGITHWDDTPINEWENTDTATNVNNASPVLSRISINNWDDFTGTPVALYSCLLSTAPTSITASANPVCFGSTTTTLSVTGGSLGTGATWQWYTVSCGGTSAGTGTSITVSPASTTTYYVRAEGTCGITACATLDITVNPIYSVNNPQTICSGSSYVFNGNTYTIAGNYSDTLTTINGCDSIIVTQLTVNPVYSVNNPQTICNGSSYVFNGNTYSIAGNYSDTLTTINGCDSIIVTQLTVNPVYSVNNPQTICNGSSYVFNGNTYTVAGNYSDTLTTVNGCDSIIVTQLTVNPVFSVNNPQTICNGGSYVFNGNTYTIAGNYSDTLTTTNGCDSIIVTQLTVNPVYSVNNPQTICNGNSYVFNGNTYTIAGNYSDTLTTVNGCDSIIVTQLTVNPVFFVNNPQTICNGGSYVFNGHTYTIAGNYSDTLTTINSCDSIIVTQLTVNPVFSVNNPQTICNGDSYVFNGNTYAVAGNYSDTLTTINGCDSIIVTQLTVNPVYSVNNPQTICNGSSYTFNGNTYTTAGNYNDSLTTVNGCDSIIVTQLTVNPVYSVNNPQTICNGSSYVFNGNTYTVAGNYNDTLTTVNGCDSIIVTQLTVNPVFVTLSAVEVCNGDSYIFNGNTYTVAGNYSDTLATINGCDSIIVTQLTVNPVYSVNNPQTICNGSSYIFNGNTYTIAGNYSDTLTTINGCDSIIVTQLTVNPVFSVNNPQTICSGSSYTFNGNTYTIAGNYNDTLTTVNGCDSIIVTQLTVNTVYSVNNPQTICNGSSYVFNGNTYTIAGNYSDTLTTINGCDSIIVTQLTVNPVYTINNPQAICSGGSYVFNGNTYTIAGNYSDTLTTINGCDSIIVTQLTVNPVYSANNPQTICNGGSYVFNGNTYTVAGNYSDTLTTINGCDSIIVTQLTVNPVYIINQSVTICNGDSALINGTYYYIAGGYADTLTTVSGCDSIIVTQLNVNPVYNTTASASICQGQSYNFGGTSYTTAGTYPHTFTSVLGCDSIVTLTLTVNPTYNNTATATICQGQSYSFGGTNYNTSGTYPHTFTSALGCDSIVTLTLNVNPAYFVNNPQAICNGGNYVFNGHTYTVAGSYNDTLTTVNGCDSIIVTQLTMNPVYSVNNPQTICNGGSYVFNGHTYTVAGSYNDTLTTVNGCDSIIVTNLSILPTYNLSLTASICQGQSYSFGGTNYTTAGTYPHTFTSALGCDSVVTLSLTVNPSLPVGVSIGVSPSNSVCEGTEVTFTATSVNGGTNPAFQWFINGSLAGTGNTFTRNSFANNDGVYCVIASSISSCLTNNPDTSNSISLQVHPLPDISLTVTNESCLGTNDGHINLLISGGTPPYTYSWDGWQTTQNYNVDYISKNFSPGTYTVDASDAFGCKSQKAGTIEAAATACIYIPNIFSPNGDGNNDKLYVRGGGISSLEFIIYDRWGNKVFETSDQTAGWDGTYNGAAMNAAVFVYSVKVELMNGATLNEKGNVTLIR